MDFTYFVAGLLAIPVGAAAAIWRIWNTNVSLARSFVVALLASVSLSFLVLIDWRFVDASNWGFLVADLTFFLVYGLFGCLVGLVSVALINWLYRHLIA
jgi:hypothetical protein